MKFVVASTSALAIPSLVALEKAGHLFLGGISLPDAEAGRGRKLKKNDFALYCETHEYKIHYVRSSNDIEEALNDLSPEIAVAISFGKLIKERPLAIPQYGWVNLHFSLLPKYRGAAPVQRALLDGISHTGVTVFRLDKGMDTGPIYASAPYEIPTSANAQIVLADLAELGAETLVRSLDMVTAGREPTPQISEQATYAPKIDKEELRLDWNLKADLLLRKIRAFSPEPGSWALFRGRRIIIRNARIGSDNHLEAGALVFDRSLRVGTGAGSLELSLVVPEGKREMDAIDWARGARIELGDHFE